MAETPLKHGITVVEVVEGPRTLRTVATSIIGLVAVAPDADATAFPLYEPVRLTDLPDAISKAGTDGTLAKALKAIDDQVRTIVVVVRVEEGTGETPEEIELETSQNVIKGIEALRQSEQICHVRPRILIAPGVDTLPVTAALGVLAEQLNAIAYVSCAKSATVDEALTMVAGLSGRELRPIYGDFLIGDEIVYATAVAAGARAALDQSVGPHKTLSNVPVKGITGMTAAVSWDLQNENTDAGLLNAAGICVLVQRDGFRFWGNRGLSAEPKFSFESAVRTAQILRDTIAEGLLWAIDKPLYPSLAIDLIETINVKFDELRDAGIIIGAKARLADNNTTTSLADGQLKIVYDYTPVPPLEHLHLTQVITDEYFADFAAQVEAG